MIKKYLLGFFVIFSLSGNILANDIAEDNANAIKISNIVSKSLSQVGMDTAIAETFGTFAYRVVGEVSKKIVFKFASGEQFVKTHEYIALMIENGTFERKIFRKLNDGLQSDLLLLASDIFIELVKNSIEEYSTLEYRYQKSLLWWIDIGYNDLKAVLNPNKVVAVTDLVLDNGAVLIDMATEINKTLTELRRTQWQIKFNNAMFNIDEYKSDALKQYTRATTQKEKDEILDTFKVLCNGEKVSENIFSSDYRELFNIKIEELKFRYALYIYNFDKEKFSPLLLMLENNNFDQYKRYVNHFFPSDVASFLIINYNYYYATRHITSVSRNTMIFEYVIKVLDKGFELEDFDVFYMAHIKNNSMPISKVYTVVGKIAYKLYGGSEPTISYNENTISRKNFAQVLNNQISLDTYLSKAAKNDIQNNRNKNGNLNYDILVLNKLGIMQGVPLTTDFRPDDPLSKLELMIMTVRTLDYCEENKERIMQ